MTSLGWRRCLAAAVVLVSLSGGAGEMPGGHVVAAARTEVSHTSLGAGTAPRSCRAVLRAGQHGGHALNLPVACLQAIVAAPRSTVLPSGVITTTAGGARGGGKPTSYGLEPYGVALDGVGRVLIADRSNSLVWLANLSGSAVTAYGQRIAAGRMVSVAGNDTPVGMYEGFGGDGGPAIQAELYYPSGVAVDGAGNLFIADSSNNRIREVLAATGIITTVAGGGSCGSLFCGDGGPAIQARLYGPSSVVVDGAGNLFIADENNQRIREVLAATGVITTVAGSGTKGFSGDGGPATQAELYYPAGVAVDGAGNLFIADTDNSRIREVLAASGVITTVAGSNTVGFGGDSGPATQAALNYPAGVTVDGIGNLFVADTGNQRIREVLAASGIITTVAGNGCISPAGGCFGGDGGPATQAELNQPRGVAVDGAGNLFIVDTNNNRIREVVATTGLINTVAGNGSCCFGGDGSHATGAELNFPRGVAVDTAGNLFIADTANSRIREVLKATSLIATVAGNGSPGCHSGGPGPCFGGDGGPATQAELNGPYSMAVDGVGNLFIADTGNSRIREVLAATGIITTVAGGGRHGLGDGGPATSAELKRPDGVAMDRAGDLFIADTGNQRIREVVAATGLITTVAGGGNCGALYYCGDGGPATQAELYYPAEVAVDGAGNLFIADTGNNRIREVVAATGIITTVAGTGRFGYGGDGGPATQADLNQPTGVAVDSAGNLFIADNVNDRIREVLAASGVITTVAGNGVGDFGGDGGPATRAKLNQPAGVAVDGSGNILVADYGNNRVRLVRLR